MVDFQKKKTDSMCIYNLMELHCLSKLFLCDIVVRQEQTMTCLNEWSSTDSLLPKGNVQLCHFTLNGTHLSLSSYVPDTNGRLARGESKAINVRCSWQDTNERMNGRTDERTNRELAVISFARH